MRAAILTGPGRFEVRQVARPQVGPGQVRIKLEGCGVCASNLVPWAGPDWMKYPTAPGGLGHEGWGVVDQLGEGVRTLAIGDRVATLSQNSYAEYDVADQSAVVPLPLSLGGGPFPGEPLGCAENIFRRCGIEPGHVVAILGIGFLGAILTQLAVEAGATVIAVSRRPASLELASQLGATYALPIDDPATVARVAEATQGRLCDVVIEATGKQQPLDLAAELTSVRGRLVIAGYHQDGPRSVNMQLWNWRGLDVINAHEREPAIYAQGVRQAIADIEAGRIDPLPLFTHSFRLEELGAALDATRDRPAGFVKALVLM